MATETRKCKTINDVLDLLADFEVKVCLCASGFI